MVKPKFMEQSITFRLPIEVSNKLDDLGFDYSKNLEEMCLRVYLEILKTEMKEEDE